MPILTRYTLTQLFIALAITTGGLALLIWLMQALHFISLVVEHGLSFPLFIGLTSLLIPSFIAIILPVTTFVIIVFVYSRFRGDHELTIMRGCGQSTMQLSRPGLLCALGAAALSAILSLWIVPLSYHHFRQYEYQLRGQVALLMLQEGTFTRISDALTVYIHDKKRNGTLNRILIQDDRIGGEHATILAKTGHLIPSEESPKIILRDGSRQSLDRKSGHLNILSFTEEAIALDQGKKVERHTEDIVEMSTAKLLKKDKHLTRSMRAKYTVEVWRRILVPFECLSFAFIGMATILAPRFLISRKENIKRIMIATLIVCSLVSLTILLQDLAARNTSLIVFIVLLTIIPGVLSYRMLRESDYVSR